MSSNKQLQKKKARTKKQVELEHLIIQIKKAVNEWEYKIPREPVVVYRGNINSEIMVIAEAPGKKESEQQLPLVGKSGKLFNAMVAEVGIEQEQMFLCNVMMQRPPRNRNPTYIELCFYIPYLKELIRIMKPKIIICLGRYPATVIYKRFHTNYLFNDNIGLNKPHDPRTLTQQIAAERCDVDLVSIASLREQELHEDTLVFIDSISQVRLKNQPPIINTNQINNNENNENMILIEETNPIGKTTPILCRPGKHIYDSYGISIQCRFCGDHYIQEECAEKLVKPFSIRVIYSNHPSALLRSKLFKEYLKTYNRYSMGHDIYIAKCKKENKEAKAKVTKYEYIAKISRQEFERHQEKTKNIKKMAHVTLPPEPHELLYKWVGNFKRVLLHLGIKRRPSFQIGILPREYAGEIPGKTVYDTSESIITKHGPLRPKVNVKRLRETIKENDAQLQFQMTSFKHIERENLYYLFGRTKNRESVCVLVHKMKFHFYAIIPECVVTQLLGSYIRGNRLWQFEDKISELLTQLLKKQVNGKSTFLRSIVGMNGPTIRVEVDIVLDKKPGVLYYKNPKPFIRVNYYHRSLFYTLQKIVKQFWTEYVYTNISAQHTQDFVYSDYDLYDTDINATEQLCLENGLYSCGWVSIKDPGTYKIQGISPIKTMRSHCDIELQVNVDQLIGHSPKKSEWSHNTPMKIESFDIEVHGTNVLPTPQIAPVICICSTVEWTVDGMPLEKLRDTKDPSGRKTEFTGRAAFLSENIFSLGDYDKPIPVEPFDEKYLPNPPFVPDPWVSNLTKLTLDIKMCGNDQNKKDEVYGGFWYICEEWRHYFREYKAWIDLVGYNRFYWVITDTERGENGKKQFRKFVELLLECGDVDSKSLLDGAKKDIMSAKGPIHMRKVHPQLTIWLKHLSTMYRIINKSVFPERSSQVSEYKWSERADMSKLNNDFEGPVSVHVHELIKEKFLSNKAYQLGSIEFNWERFHPKPRKHVFRTEYELLKAYAVYIIQSDPDIITGYNMKSFDLNYLIRRARVLGCWDSVHEQRFSFSRIRKDQDLLKMLIRTTRAHGSIKKVDVVITGREMIDVMTFFRKEYKLESYRLGYVSTKFIGDTKNDVPYTSIGSLFYHNRTKLNHYCLVDARLPMQLLNKLTIFYYYLEFIKLIGAIVISDFETRGQGIRGKLIVRRVIKDEGDKILIPKRSIFGSRTNRMDERKRTFTNFRDYSQRVAQKIENSFYSVDWFEGNINKHENSEFSGANIEIVLQKAGVEQNQVDLKKIMDETLLRDRGAKYQGAIVLEPIRGNHGAHVDKIKKTKQAIMRKNPNKRQKTLASTFKKEKTKPLNNNSVTENMQLIKPKPVTKTKKKGYQSSMASFFLSNKTTNKGGSGKHSKFLRAPINKPKPKRQFNRKRRRQITMKQEHEVNECPSILEGYPILFLDYRGLYPSIILLKNYCFSMCGTEAHMKSQGINTDQCNRVDILFPEFRRKDRKYSHGPKNVYYYFLKGQYDIGIIVKSLKQLLELRSRNKKEMFKHPPGSFLYNVFNQRQGANKVSANSMYGTQGDGKNLFACGPSAAGTTWTGRNIINDLQCVMKRDKGARTIGGDTDSVFIQAPDIKNEQDVLEKYKEYEDFGNSRVEKPVELEFEGYGVSVCLIEKKRYFKIIKELQRDKITGKYIFPKKPTFVAKGMEFVRRDAFKFIKITQEKFCKTLMLGEDPDEAIMVVKDAFQKLVDGTVDYYYLVESRKYSKLEYSNSNLPHLKVIEIEKSLGRPIPELGQRIPFLMTTLSAKVAGRKQKQNKSEGARPPYMVMEQNLPLDWNYYQIRFIRSFCKILKWVLPTPDILRILALTQEHVKVIQDVLSCRFTQQVINAALKGKKKHVIKAIFERGASKLINNNERQALGKFLTKKWNCIGCNSVSNTHICKKCLNNKTKKQELHEDFIDKFKKLSIIHEEVMTKCRDCTGIKKGEILCENFDCRHYYTRKSKGHSIKHMKSIGELF